MRKLIGLRSFQISTVRRQSLNAFTCRSHTCGELRLSHAGQQVEMYGWLAYRRMNRFLVLRDAYGFTQLRISDEVRPSLEAQLRRLNYESAVKAVGVVTDRGADRNANMPTGDVEVDVRALEVLSMAPTALPLTLKVDAQERTRLAHRYLDLRTTTMQRNLRLRSLLGHRMRRALVERFGFVEVETPTLAQWTPGGAHEFAVPCGKPLRGAFYSLPQSPQIYKQLLMCGSIDRYFQFARCYRDEGAKTDRQPEFTQVDLELAYTTQEHVRALVEQFICGAWPEAADALPPPPCAPFRCMAYADAMRDYGTDKPDLRVPWRLADCTPAMRNVSLQRGDGGAWHAQCFVARGAAGTVTNAMRREWRRLLGMRPSSQPFEIANFARKCPFKNFDVDAFWHDQSLTDGDLVVFSWGSHLQAVQETLGQLRNYVGECVGYRAEARFEWLWIVDFPLFLRNEHGALESAHHPFTAPAHGDVESLRATRNLDALKSQHYDLVLNGVELGGGSIRINDAQLQRHVFDILALPSAPLARFVDALAVGAPPHGGFALGFDRLVALLACRGAANASIRDVIAFPKTKEGKCLMLGAPSEPQRELLERYALEVVAPVDDESAKASG